MDGSPHAFEALDGSAIFETPSDLSALIDLSPSLRRAGKVHLAQPNTNLVASKTCVPQLTVRIPAGLSVLSCAVIALGNPSAARAALQALPAKPDPRVLEALVATKGKPVTLMRRNRVV
jgi:hypothetical protein